MRPGKQFLAYVNKITLAPKATLNQVTLSPHGEKLLDEALQDVKKGKTKAFDSAEELIASLKKTRLFLTEGLRKDLRTHLKDRGVK